MKVNEFELKVYALQTTSGQRSECGPHCSLNVSGMSCWSRPQEDCTATPAPNPAPSAVSQAACATEELGQTQTHCSGATVSWHRCPRSDCLPLSNMDQEWQREKKRKREEGRVTHRSLTMGVRQIKGVVALLRRPPGVQCSVLLQQQHIQLICIMVFSSR